MVPSGKLSWMVTISFMLLQLSENGSALALSVHQPTLCASAVWNSSGVTLMNESMHGRLPVTIFIDNQNMIYLTAMDQTSVRIWDENYPFTNRTAANNLNQSQGLFLSAQQDIYVDNRGQIEKWVINQSSPIVVMIVNASCFSLFVSLTDDLYCSIPTLHRVVSKSLNLTSMSPTSAFGTGINGSHANQLSIPLGIFVTIRNDLYVADCRNNRIQIFKRNQTNGTTLNIVGLQCPTGIIIDSYEYLFILDRGRGRIFRSDSKNIRCLIGCNGVGSASNQLNHPSSFSFDQQGNIYVVDHNNRRIQKFFLASNSCGLSYHRPKFSSCAQWDSMGITVANSSTVGNRTLGIFIDQNDTIYAAVRAFQRIKMWTKGNSIPQENFNISSNARSMFVSANGDIYVEHITQNRIQKWRWGDPLPVSVMFIRGSCYGLFIDIKENLYCSLGDQHLILRKSFMSEINDTVIIAGNGTADSRLDRLNNPRGIFVDLALNLYVADCRNNRILRFSRNSLMGTVVAGNGINGTIVLRCPSSVILDANGFLFISDYDRNRIVASGSRGFRCIIGCSAGSSAGAHQLQDPYGLSFDSDGNLFVADAGNDRIQKFNLIRNSCPVSYNQPILCSNATWSQFSSVLIDNNTIFGDRVNAFVDIYNSLYITSNGRQFAQLRINGSNSSIRNFSTGFNSPAAIFADTDGNIYVDNGGNGNRRVDKYTKDSSTPTPAMRVIDRCFFLFIDSFDHLYCSIDINHQVIRRSLNENINQTTVVAGNGSAGAANHQLNGPRGIFVTSNMTLYIADAFNNRIQMYQPDQLNGTTIVGQSFSLNRPIGIILDGNGYLFIADAGNNRIIGSGPFGFRCLIGCNSRSNQLSYPRSIHFDTDGNMIVMNSGTRQLLRFTLTTNSCTDSSYLSSSAAVTFSSPTVMTTQTIDLSINSSYFTPTCTSIHTIGSSCNISTDPCTVLNPCHHQATCINTNTTISGYQCICPMHFNGVHCQYSDYQPCVPTTCLHNGTCQLHGNSTWSCQCSQGWQGIFCENLINYCSTVQCLNGGVCRPLLLEYRCECLDESYSGKHCEIVSSRINTLQNVSRSVAYIAIIILITFGIFIVAMDIIKYHFAFDSIEKEILQIRREKEKKIRRRRKFV